ncbi:MAG: T9SS type A sorting domain-containing protein, partial [Bacteroidota bacterium]
SPDNKNLIISGMSNSHAGFDKTEENFVDCALSWMQCIDTNGNQLWDKSVRTWDPDVAGSTIFIDDHCFYYITSSGSDTGGDKTKLPIDLGGNDFWVLKYCDSPTSIDQLQQNNSYDIEAYPSPANSNLTIETQNGILPKRIIITDALGKQLLNIKGQERKTEIDVSLFDSGIYFVNVQGQDGSVTVKKFIKE